MDRAELPAAPGPRLPRRFLRSFEAYAILAGAPLIAIAYFAGQLSAIVQPHHTTPPAAVSSPAPTASTPQTARAMPTPAVVTPVAPRVMHADAVLGGGLHHETRGDPVGDYVAKLGLGPTHVTYTVRPGDTLIGVLGKVGIDSRDAHRAVAALQEAKLASQARIRPHQHVKVELGGAAHAGDDRTLIAASIPVDAEHSIAVKRAVDGGFQASTVIHELTPERFLARGTISSSLSGAAAAEDVPYSIVAKFAQIYAYDVDFQRDIHPDDSFEIYYTQMVGDDGQRAVGKGEILFASLTYGGKMKSFYRYTSLDGKTTDYYDAHGKSARTFLMRTPIDGARISSPFGMRKHPILGYTRMHQGVDFAAPIGTKIFAAGAGVIERAGRNGGYGNFIEIKHAHGYQTEYGHLSRYAKGIKKGVHVAQGQVIGYVGSTGLSTGPHLHYGVLVRGKFVNPLSVKVPTGTKLAGADLDRFESRVERVDVAMKNAPQNQLASAGGIGTEGSRTR
jgi:murein DD-endopeptidase MepM/ murein hydrolase activator NlpD